MRTPVDLSRRVLIARALAVGVTAALGSGCAGRRARTVVRRLTPVDARAERVIRVVTGLRPYRSGGFVVCRETHGSKTLVHNCGRGGDGVSLSWGTAKLAVDPLADAPHRACAVIGGGSVGVATARLLRNRGFAVTIYARELPPDTVPNVAGAWWSPYSVYNQTEATAEFLAQFKHASNFAFQRFQGLVGPRRGSGWRLAVSRNTEAPVALGTYNS